METFIQPKITGYRQLNELEAAYMNEIKAQGATLDLLCKRLMSKAVDDQVLRGEDTLESARWINLGRTHLQQGLMALTRAVARPTSF